MGYSLNVCASEASRSEITALWDVVGRIEGASSMRMLGYPPHITLAIYDTDEVDAGAAKAAFDSCVGGGGAMVLRFDSMRCFTGPPMVLWLAPEPDGLLRRVHAAAHGAIDPLLSREHYRPGRWTPHCTLGNRIGRDGEHAASALMAGFDGGLTVAFDTVECVSFPPLRSMLWHRWSDAAVQP